MSNVQGALKSALFAIRCHRTEITLDKKRPNDLIEVDLVISKIEAALAELEKCEPVALLALNNTVMKRRIEVLEDLLTSAAAIASRNGEGTHWDRFTGQLKINGIGNITAKTFRVLPSDDGYTSPQPREWVGLDAHQIIEIRQSMLTDGCLDTVEFADAITAKLKQLNTKG